MSQYKLRRDLTLAFYPSQEHNYFTILFLCWYFTNCDEPLRVYDWGSCEINTLTMMAEKIQLVSGK